VALAVDVQDISKRFRLYHEKYNSLKEKLIHAGRVPYEDLWALRNVSFEVEEGETVGILGRNGSGKSTLLKCICGVLKPTDGQVVVRGKLAGLLELGAGFQQDLSGRENIYLNGSMLGMSKREVDRVFDAIVDFAELEQFIDNQVKFYSSGMYVRLGFAVAVNVDPDVLVIDEVLAVGDERFQRKCLDRIKQFQNEGRTILFVSHSPDQVRSICERAVVLSDGHMVGLTTPGEAVRIFRETLMEGSDSLAAQRDDPRGLRVPVDHLAGGDHDRGSESASDYEPPTDFDPSRPVRLTEVWVAHPKSGTRPYVVTGDPITVHVSFEAYAPTEGVVFSVELRDDKGNVIERTDTEIMNARYDLPAGPGRMEFRFVSFPFLDGTYEVNIGVQSRLGGDLFDWWEPAETFEVVHPGRSTGTVSLPVHAALVRSGGVDLAEELLAQA
jgi:ABC-2 type transport system ATP-binding protein